MLVASSKQRGDKFIPVLNGVETLWLPKEKGGRYDRKIKNRPFRDWNGDILTFHDDFECRTWCIAYNRIQNTSMI